MKLNPFSRKPKAQPKPVTGNLYNSATAVMPIAPTAVIPVAPTIKTHSPEDMQYCAACGEIGAKYRQRSGDFYLGPIFYFLCNTCYEKRIEKHMQHVFGQRKEYPPTNVRIKAVSDAKLKGGIIQHTGMAIVGEPGPESLIFPKDATIVPTSTTPHVTLHVKIDDREYPTSVRVCECASRK